MKYYEIDEQDLKNLLYQAHKLTALESAVLTIGVFMENLFPLL